MRLVPLFFCGLIAACASTTPRVISGTLPTKGTYSIVAAEAIAPPAQTALAHALDSRGMSPASEGQCPDRLVSMTFADRPLPNGSFAGDKAPADRKADGWLDRPHKSTFAHNRREIRLTIRFLSCDGQLREQRSATQTIARRASAPDLSQLIAAALRS